jgi:hypothetical protein
MDLAARALADYDAGAHDEKRKCVGIDFENISGLVEVSGGPGFSEGLGQERLDVEEPEAADGDTDAENGCGRDEQLYRELSVFHSDFLAQALDLNGHEVDP